MFFKYLTVQRAFLFALMLFFANRSWNYFDRIVDNNMSRDAVCKYGLPFVVTFGLFCFFLGFTICREIKYSAGKQPVQN